MDVRGIDRRRALATLALAGGGAVVGGPAAASDQPVGLVDGDRPSTAQGALRRLLRGNARFAAGRARHLGQDVGAVRRVAAGQHPYVVVLGCSDSRVPPEVLFDEGVGTIFDQRVAGGIVDPAILGSIEYAVGEFAPPLLVVLGHERCGAVSATVEVVEHGGRGPEHVQTIVEAIRPAVLAVRDRPGDVVEHAVRENARMVARQLTRRSGIIRRAVRAGRLEVRAARYDLDTGLVRLL